MICSRTPHSAPCVPHLQQLCSIRSRTSLLLLCAHRAPPMLALGRHLSSASELSASCLRDASRGGQPLLGSPCSSTA